MFFDIWKIIAKYYNKSWVDLVCEWKREIRFGTASTFKNMSKKWKRGTFENSSNRLIEFVNVSAAAFVRPLGLNGNKHNSIKKSCISSGQHDWKIEVLNRVFSAEFNFWLIDGHLSKRAFSLTASWIEWKSYKTYHKNWIKISFILF